MKSQRNSTFSSSIVSDSFQPFVPCQFPLVITSLSKRVEFLKPHFFHEIQLASCIESWRIQWFHLIEDLKINCRHLTHSNPSAALYNCVTRRRRKLVSINYSLVRPAPTKTLSFVVFLIRKTQAVVSRVDSPSLVAFCSSWLLQIMFEPGNRAFKRIDSMFWFTQSVSFPRISNKH